MSTINEFLIRWARLNGVERGGHLWHQKRQSILNAARARLGTGPYDRTLYQSQQNVLRILQQNELGRDRYAGVAFEPLEITGRANYDNSRRRPRPMVSATSMDTRTAEESQQTITDEERGLIPPVHVRYGSPTAAVEPVEFLREQSHDHIYVQSINFDIDPDRIPAADLNPEAADFATRFSRVSASLTGPIDAVLSLLDESRTPNLYVTIAQEFTQEVQEQVDRRVRAVAASPAVAHAAGHALRNHRLERFYAELGEEVFRDILRRRGFDVISVQYNGRSGHGLDIVARRSYASGRQSWFVFEVKTSQGVEGVLGRLIRPNPREFIRSRLTRALNQFRNQLTPRQITMARDLLRHINNGGTINFGFVRIQRIFDVEPTTGPRSRSGARIRVDRVDAHPEAKNASRNPRRLFRQVIRHLFPL